MCHGVPAPEQPQQGAPREEEGEQVAGLLSALRFSAETAPSFPLSDPLIAPQAPTQAPAIAYPHHLPRARDEGFPDAQLRRIQVEFPRVRLDDAWAASQGAPLSGGSTKWHLFFFWFPDAAQRSQERSDEHEGKGFLLEGSLEYDCVPRNPNSHHTTGFPEQSVIEHTSSKGKQKGNRKTLLLNSSALISFSFAF